MKKSTTKEFIEKAKKIHGDKYDYSKTVYVNKKTKLTITCPEHGDFTKMPPDHIYGAGCPKCSKTKILTTEDFIKKAEEVHGDRYDYSKVVYKSYSTVVCIICPEHGEFFKTPKRFLSGSGCNKCLEEQSKERYKNKGSNPRCWTKEKCYEEAKKYTNREQFSKNCSGGYHSALFNGWLEDYTWFEKPILWTKEKCYEEAQRYTSKKSFEENSSGCYSAALRNNWLDSYTWLKTEPHEGKIDNIYVYFFEESNSIYVGRTVDIRSRDLDHRRNNSKSSVYLFSEENKVSIPPIKVLESNLTVEEGAEREKYWLYHYKSNGFNIINKVPAGSIGNPGVVKWNKETCYNEAKKYLTLAEFNKERRWCYDVAKKNNWLKDYTWLKGRFRWTEELYLEKAKECKDLGDLKKKFPNCYKAALRHKWSGGFCDE